jgi:hypothetical protein
MPQLAFGCALNFLQLYRSRPDPKMLRNGEQHDGDALESDKGAPFFH